MNFLKQRVRGNRAALALVILTLTVLPMVLGPVSPAVTAQAATTSHPACRASQIKVSSGATLTNTTYPFRTSTGVRQEPAYEVIPVYFYDQGATCHLLMGAPDIRAVRDTTNVTNLKTITMHDLSVPVSADNTRREVVGHHQKLEALFVVVRPVGPPFTGCSPATTSGILVQGYASPIGTFHFIVRRLRDVCFDSGVGQNVLDYGVAWPSV